MAWTVNLGEEQLNKAQSAIEEAISAGKNNTDGDYTSLGILFKILLALECEFPKGHLTYPPGVR